MPVADFAEDKAQSGNLELFIKDKQICRNSGVDAKFRQHKNLSSGREKVLNEVSKR